MEFLQNLAANGQASLCAIHHPSAELFEVFDKPLLCKGNETVYFGKQTFLARLCRSQYCHPSQVISSLTLAYSSATSSVMVLVLVYRMRILLKSCLMSSERATASSKQNWYDVWKRSEESIEVQREVDAIGHDGMINLQ